MNTQDQHKTKKTSDMKMLGAMVSIGLICALLIVVTFEQTKPVIAKNKAEALEKAIFKVVPGISSVANYSLDEQNQLRKAEGAKDADVIYVCYDEQGNFKGVAIEAAGQGYADIIRILYGYDAVEQQIIGFYVLESKETPGLGDKIEKDPSFLANFKAMDVALNEEDAIVNAIVAVKSGQKEAAWEVDGITGATISSRAIAEILAASTAHWMPIIYTQQEKFNRDNQTTQNDDGGQ